MPCLALKDAAFCGKTGIFSAKYMHTFVFSVITVCYGGRYACIQIHAVFTPSRIIFYKPRIIRRLCKVIV